MLARLHEIDVLVTLAFTAAVGTAAGPRLKLVQFRRQVSIASTTRRGETPVNLIQ